VGVSRVFTLHAAPPPAGVGVVLKSAANVQKAKKKEIPDKPRTLERMNAHRPQKCLGEGSKKAAP